MGVALTTETAQSKPRWEGPVVPYTMSPNLTSVDRTRILAGIAQWEQLTNLRFVARDSQSDYVEFRIGQFFCSSPVGRQGGKQSVTLEPGFGVDTLIHELGHALGLQHEHQRPDRDSFVTVDEDKIQPGQGHNFDKLSPADVVVGPTYDLRSIMHYRASTFGAGGQSPLESIPPGQTMDTSSTLTATDSGFVNLIYPNLSVVRRSSSSDLSSDDIHVSGAGGAKQIATARDDLADSVVTAVITTSNTLLLINWSVDNLGAVSRLSDSADQAGVASSPAIAKGSAHLYVTGCRSGSGALLLISWDVTSGKIERLGDSGSLAGEASLVRIISLDGSVFLTACRAGNGKLLLITWRVQPDGRFERLADSGDQAGEVSEISLLRLRSTSTAHFVVTTVRTGSGTANSICWEIPLSADAVKRRGHSDTQIGAATQISSAVDPFGHFVVSCRSASGSLLVITLEVSADAATVTRLQDSGDQAGAISENAMMARPHGVVSAVRRGNGNLLLIAWRIARNGRIVRGGDSSDQAGAASSITIGPAPARALDAPVVTALRRPGGNLLLISWDDESMTGEV
jgi:hypothetical protein